MASKRTRTYEIEKLFTVDEVAVIGGIAAAVGLALLAILVFTINVTGGLIAQMTSGMM